MKKYKLRLDNSGCSVICNIDDISETMLYTITCDIPNERADFFLSDDMNDFYR